MLFSLPLDSRLLTREGSTSARAHEHGKLRARSTLLDIEATQVFCIRRVLEYCVPRVRSCPEIAKERKIER